MGPIARNNSIAYGIAEHARFHQLCSMHHNPLTRNYKIYSYLQFFIFAMLAIAFIVWFSNVRLTASSEWIAGTLLIVIPAVAIVVFAVDHLLLRVLFTMEQRQYINEMPHKLLRADLYASEKRYCSDNQPNGFVPDQLFLNDDAEIVICDTKTRDRLRVYPTDTQQIVKYATELSSLESRRICRTAYIRCVTPSVTRFLPIKLRF